MFYKQRIVSGLCGALLMVACSGGQVEDGIIDYRLAANNRVVRNAADVRGNRHLAKLQEKYLHDAKADTYIQPGDSLSIHLQQVFLNDVSSDQIAVVAKVYEHTRESGDILDTTVKSGRLVHYAAGVKKDGQYLNFSSLPLYGPITYHGKPMVLELFVMELDKVKSPRQRRLLNFLARAGGTAHPPSSPVLKLLDAVGETLLDNPESDRIFKFRMVLYPKIEEDLLNAARMRVGNYVFVKQKDENDEIPWKNLRLNKVTGRLVSNGNKENWKDKSYMIVQLNKGYNSVELDSAQLASEVFGKLNESTVNDSRAMTDMMSRLQQGLGEIRDRNANRGKRSFGARR